MVVSFDFSPYFNSPETLAKIFLETYFEGKKPVYPIDPFKILQDLGVPFVFRDFKKYEGVYIALEGIKKSGCPL
jgi:hypothetical protein